MQIQFTIALLIAMAACSTLEDHRGCYKFDIGVDFVIRNLQAQAVAILNSAESSVRQEDCHFSAEILPRSFALAPSDTQVRLRFPLQVSKCGPSIEVGFEATVELERGTGKLSVGEIKIQNCSGSLCPRVTSTFAAFYASRAPFFSMPSPHRLMHGLLRSLNSLTNVTSIRLSSTAFSASFGCPEASEPVDSDQFRFTASGNLLEVLAPRDYEIKLDSLPDSKQGKMIAESLEQIGLGGVSGTVTFPTASSLS